MPEPRQWINQRQPQTLVIATVLLYLNAAFRVLDLFRYKGLADSSHQVIWAGIALVSIAGGFGVANEKKWGYWLAVAASIAPFAERIYNGAPLFGDFLSVAIEVALVALLLHPQSRNYQRLWFK